MNDIAQSMSNSLSRDGQGGMRADLSLGGYSLTNISGLAAVTAVVNTLTVNNTGTNDSTVELRNSGLLKIVLGYSPTVGGFYLNSYDNSGALIATQMSVSRTTGIMSLLQRPTWAGFTPWDSGNLTPGNYAQLAGAAFTGAVSFTSASFSGAVSFGGLVSVLRVNATGTNDATTTYLNNASTRIVSGYSPSNDIFYINTFDNSGNFIATPFQINRTTGVATLGTVVATSFNGPVQLASGYTLTQSGGKILIGVGGTNVMSIDGSGNIRILGNLTASAGSL